MRSASQRAPKGEIIHRAMRLDTRSLQPGGDTLEVIWTTGAPVERYTWDGTPFIETLEVSARAIRMGRLTDGASVLDSHDMYELAAAIGSVVPGTARIERGQGVAEIRLSDAADVADVVSKIRAGHVRSVSVGYIVHTYERLHGDKGEADELRAIDWEPVEISFVTVPADPGAHVRSGSNHDMARTIDNGNRRQRSQGRSLQHRARLDGDQEAPRGRDDRGDDDDRDAPRRARSSAPDDRGRDDLEFDRRGGARPGQATTIDRIRAMCERANLSRGFERELLDQHDELPLTETQLLRAINDELVGRQPGNVDARAEDRPNPGAGGNNGPNTLAMRMEDALYARMSGATPTDQAREFMGASLIDMTRGLLEERGQRVRWMGKSQIIDTMSRFGAHTTSDFPNVFGNAARRYLLDLFTAYPSPLRALAHPRSAADFRTISLVKIGVNPALLVVNENGEFTRGSIAEAAEGYKLNTYGRIFAITRQALINDDLGAFASVFKGWARAAMELEATLLAGLISGNPIMSDGNALYSAPHGNLAGAGTPITVAALSAGRLAMRTQKDLDKVTPVNAGPRYLVVGAAKETEGEQVLAQLAAATVAGVNPFPGKLELLVDPRLPGNAWRLFADPAQWPVLEIARLAGQEDVFVDSRVGFDVDGVETKARVDIGGAVVDWRGSYLNPGD